MNSKWSSFVLATLVAVEGSGLAKAADMPVKSALAKPVPQAFSWTGCYVGGFGSYNVANTWRTADVNGFNPGAESPWLFGLPATFGGGGTAGCNWQPFSNFVLGLEGEGGYLSFDGNVPQPNPNLKAKFPNLFETVKVGSQYGIFAGRAGLSYDHWFVYSKFGVAYYESSTAINNGAGIIATANQPQAPFLIGGGAEWAFDDHWTVKAEYLYFLPFTLSTYNAPTVIGSTTFNFNTSPSPIQTFKVGLNYKF